ncbi:MAG: AAA family ATPase [Sandaracinaceae bacterium]|nr:AAA family ATPase [Sandaracinaceae bacterium]
MAVDLGPLSVLVGPNGAGKSNLLGVIRFLGDTARADLLPALKMHGGFDSLLYRGSSPVTSGRRRTMSIRLAVHAQVTRYASPNALDEYSLTVRKYGNDAYGREESIRFKRTKGRGRRIQVSGDRVEVVDEGAAGQERSLAQGSAALSTLPRLGKDAGGEQVGQLADLFSTFRVFDVDVRAARAPGRLSPASALEPDASNLATFLVGLEASEPEVFDLLQRDLGYVVPGFRRLELVPLGGAASAVMVAIRERGLSGATPLADASFGTVRATALLAMLHDPSPPKLTCVEEVDHGLHPHAIDRLVQRMREASTRTQILVATHSPTFVNRLEPAELIVCERDVETGESRIPAIAAEDVAHAASGTELGLGELWFTGALGGGLP